MLKQFITLCLCLSSLSLAAAPQIQSISPTDVAYGKTSKIDIQGTWDQGDQLALKPAGPMRDTFLNLNSQVTHMAGSSNTLIVATEDHQLLFLDKKLAAITTIKFKHSITAVDSFADTAAVAVRNKGLILYNIADSSRSRSLRQYNTSETITSVRLTKNRAYLILNQQTLQIVNLSNMELVRETSFDSNVNDIDVKDDRLYFTGSHTMAGNLDISHDNPLKVTSKYAANFPGEKIKIVGQQAYVANGSGGLVVLDVSNPDKIRWLGSHNKLGDIHEVHISMGQAIVNDSYQRLASLNINNPELPITGTFYQPEQPTTVTTVIGSMAYLATNNGIERVDFSKSASVQISNEGINQGGSRRAFVQNKRAYVADWFSGLHIYDMSNPQRPIHLSNYHTPGSSKGVVVRDNIAYVGDDDHGLQILDVSNPLQPQKISEILSTGLAYTMKMVGTLIYLADHRGGFHVIDVSDKHKPKMLSSYDTPGKSWAIDVVENIAYVADDSSGLLIFDVSKPTQPVQIGQFNPGGYAEDVIVSKQKAYVSFFDKGLYILDISQPTAPLVIGHSAIPGNARSISVKGSYAYIAGWESGLQIVDISTASNPTIVSSLDTDGSAWGLNLDDQYVYLWDWWGGIKVINVNNPLQPKLVGQYHGRGRIENLSIQGNYLYTANQSGGMQVFDVKNPLNPIWATGVDFDSDIVDVWTNETTAFLAAGPHGVRQVDISDPFHVKKLPPLLSGAANIIQVRGNGEFIAARDPHKGLMLINLSAGNKTPQLFHTKAMSDFCLTQSGLIVSASNNLSLYTLNPGNIDQPKLVDTFTMTSKAGIVRTSQHLVAAVEQNKGVHLLELKNQQLLPRFFVPLKDKVFDMNIIGHQLYIGSQRLGLLVFDIQNDRQRGPRLAALYPATSRMNGFKIHQGAAFFAGEKTVHSVTLLPSTHMKTTGKNTVSIEIPAFMPIGEYQIVGLDQQGNLYQYPKSFAVKLKKAKKPKFSMDDFKRIMKQKNLKPTVQ